ncbi:hypothetical protein GCM10009827_103650 [Dactylosporangium maewongense]|uniref:Uncharacterized protein n=1 Tax=Dactylosporangium maewongense TaxID=634393 RepID=A0ABP4NRR6_9ACTN
MLPGAAVRQEAAPSEAAMDEMAFSETAEQEAASVRRRAGGALQRRLCRDYSWRSIRSCVTGSPSERPMGQTLTMLRAGSRIRLRMDWTAPRRLACSAV